MLGFHGGVEVDLNTLEVGTEFFVHSGHWYGSIVLKDGAKCIFFKDGKLEDAIPTEGGYLLDISILDGTTKDGAPKTKNPKKLYIIKNENGDIYATNALSEGNKLVSVEDLEKEDWLFKRFPYTIFIVKE